MLSLWALEDPARATGGTRIPIEQRLVVIGRIPNPAADGSTQSVVVERNTIGRQHASIEYRDNGFWIRDRKSLNGTFVNDRRLEDDEVALRNGDRIRVYDVEFRFETDHHASGKIHSFRRQHGIETAPGSPQALDIDVLAVEHHVDVFFEQLQNGHGEAAAGAIGRDVHAHVVLGMPAARPAVPR